MIHLTEEQAEEFQMVVEDLGGEAYLDYSGRSMYGRTCVGIVANNTDKILLNLMRALPEEIADMFEDTDIRHDSMGLDTIVYFPYITTEEIK